ncbi:ribonuclease III [Thauera sp.]|jgi:ribonuclease-3|uniref:ribonuclease III n=1 Tax=Thauera sp. TaxID=1905334 RepID=UPI002605AB0B|nr:ribonuclease III [Thauera sp.]MCK6407726.1 ribonuclease III [Thauera sp.]
MTLERLQARLGHVFGDPRLLQEALTHRSFGQPNNERFEFLGDSILNCVTAIALFERFSELREGELSRVRASLVRQDALHRIALALELGDCLRLGEGELKSGGSRRPSILADGLEAVFAAVFLDAGFGAAKGVIDRLYQPLLAEVDPLKPSKDAKTALQEWLQARRMPVPTYIMVQALGEAHAQEFEVACEIPKLGVRTLARGASRRIAEQQSAELALAAVRKK